ncbi:MAG: MBL fold metallo-hydrolase [Promethearchaeota archaeon]
MKFIAFLEIHPDKLESFIEKLSGENLTGNNVKVLYPFQILAETYKEIAGFIIFESKNLLGRWLEIKKYLSKYAQEGVNLKLIPIWENSKLIKELNKFREAKQKAEQQWERAKYKKIDNIGTTKTLEILPLIDWHSNREDLKVELGVSYLIKTDEKSILFDVGLNSLQSDPSPLLINMKQLGISLEEIDIIVISHNHGDHVGGGKWSENKTFSLTANQIDLGKKKVYTPVPMIYPGLTPICSEEPMIVAKGVATIGTISNSLFLFGIEKEQALAINVEGKGIVLIVGCGHQTLFKIIERTETLFDEPIYGLLGGLHYPVNGGPIEIMGWFPHKTFGTGKLPWQPITVEELKENIQFLKKRNPKIIALSAHDSSEISLKAFQDAFPKLIREINVGERIIIG